MRKKHSVMLIAVLAIILCLTMAFGITAFADSEESVGNPETPVETVVEQGCGTAESAPVSAPAAASESAQTDNAPQDNALVQEDPQAEQQTPASDAPAEEAQRNEQEPGQEPVPEADVTETELPTQPTDEEPSQEPAAEAAGEPAEQQDEENPAGEEPADPDAEEISAEPASESTDGSPELPGAPAPAEETPAELPEGSSPELTGENSAACYAAQFYGLNDSVTTLTGGEEADLAELVKALGYEGEIESAVSSNPEAFDIADGKLRILSPFTDETLTVVINGQEVVICVHDPEAVTANNIVDKFKVNGGDYILNENVTLTNDTLQIPTGVSVILDLNGHVLQGPGSGSVITIVSGASLTIKDSDPQATHTGDHKNLPAGGVITGGNANYGGGVINFGNLTMSGGSIFGNTTTVYGGGVYNSGTFNMSGGSISGNGSEFDGGGVYNSGTFNMSGGSISGNSSDFAGGGVYNDGTFTMNSGSISGNGSEFGGGGGVYNYQGIFEMSDGSISGNGSDFGGGVYNYQGIFEMSGGSISGNTAHYGGGVENDGGESHILGGEITGNIANGAVCLGGGVENYGTMTVGGTASITGNKDKDGNKNNLYVYASMPVTVATGEDAPTSMSIGVTLQTGTGNAATADGEAAEYFNSDNAGYKVIDRDGNVQLCQPIDVPAAETGLVYNGETQIGVNTGTGYTLTNNTGINANSYTAIAKPDAYYCWSDGTIVDKSITFTIRPKSLDSTSIGDIAEQTYSGSSLEPVLVIKDGEKELAKGVDYEVTYSGNVNAGTATAAVSFNGNYSGNASKNFFIAPKTISVTGTTVEDKIYDGTTDATVIVGIISGVIAGDDVTVAATGTFDTAEIGTGKTVTVVYSLSGTAKDNYVFSVPSELLTASISGKTDPDPDPTPAPVVTKAIVTTTDIGATAIAEVKGTTAQIFVVGRNGEIIDPMNVTILEPAELIAMGAKTAEIRMTEKFTVVLDIEAAMCGKSVCVITIDNVNGVITVACDVVKICEADFTDIAESIAKLVYDGKTLKAYDAQGNLIRDYKMN